MSGRRPTELDVEQMPPCVCGAFVYRSLLRGEYNRLGARAYPFEIAACLACGLARTLPVPDPAQYAAGYSLTTDDNRRFCGSSSDFWSSWIVGSIRTRVEGGRLLDVGCHVGNLVAAAVGAGFEAEGIDLDPVATGEGRRLGRPVRAAAIENVEDVYDIVVVNHTLEHVLSLQGFLENLDRILSRDGCAFVFVPHYRGLMPRLMGSDWIGWFPQQHVWHFTPETLASTVTNATSLRPVSLTTRGVLEPRSSGPKGAVKAGAIGVARALRWGDQIEAVLERPNAE
ncbi:MAG: class I SAM-dependent methyltransferase [Gaiellaceae bacterium]